MDKVEEIRIKYNSISKELNERTKRLWAATETISIGLCHFPPGTSKWNKIEHRLFSRISKNWKGRPLETYAIIVNLIASTKTKTGIKISKKEIENINLQKHDFHGDDRNYTIKPQNDYLFI